VHPKEAFSLCALYIHIYVLLLSGLLPCHPPREPGKGAGVGKRRIEDVEENHSLKKVFLSRLNLGIRKILCQ
jgi:hypothetical protein